MAVLAIRDADNIIRYLDMSGDGSAVAPFVPHQRIDTVMAGTLFTAQVQVTTIGQIVQLPSRQLTHGVLIKALSTNNGSIFLGDSAVNSSNGFELDKSEALLIRIDELSKLYITATAANEGICLFGT